MTPDLIPRKSNESWRECVARIARPHDLEREALNAFDYELRHGRTQAQAAWVVLVDEFFLVSI